MLKISPLQEEELGQYLLSKFKVELTAKLSELGAIPERYKELNVFQDNEKIIEALVNKAFELGLEFESDIAVFSAFVLANSIIDESLNLELPHTWMEVIFEDDELDGDEKITVVLARWDKILARDETLTPSLVLIEQLQEAF